MDRALGEFEQSLLFALVALGENADGLAVRELIERETGREPSPGAIHITLERLQKRGLVSSRLGEPSPKRGGRRRRLYSITPSGARSLRSSYEQLKRLATGREKALHDLAEER